MEFGIPYHIMPEYQYDEKNPFINTERFSPVANGVDLPNPRDPFYISIDNWPKKQFEDEVLSKYVIDEAWWYRQRERCVNGYTVKNARLDGSDVHITGLHYFYLNFWPIYGKAKDSKTNAKTITKPKFTDLDYAIFWRIEAMKSLSKDDLFYKSRQKGFSEKAALIVGWNYTFMPSSVNIIIAGSEEDSGQTMNNAIRGLDYLINTQFYKERSKNASDEVWSLKFGSKIKQLTAGSDGMQSVSRFSPYWIVYEECYGKNTKVLMYNGEFKNIQDIRIGDVVMGNNNKPMVVGSTTKGIDDLYKINQKKGDPYIVNSKHRLYLEQKTNIKGYKNDDGVKYHTVSELQSLNKTKRSCTYGSKSSGVEFKEKPVIIDPYFLGLWLGDGDKNRMRITTCDKEIEDAVIDFCNLTMSSLKINYYKNSNNRKLDIKSIDNKFDYWKALLKKMNLYENKHIPKSYLINSRSNRLKLLAGLIDTDGSLGKSSSYSFHYEITQKSKLLADDIIYLCRSLGFRTTIKEKIINGVVYYRMTIFGKIWEIPVRIKRKIVPSDWRPTSDPLNTQISVEHIGKGEYFGFTLIADKDEDRQVIINDFTISMNCGKWPKGLVRSMKEFVDASLYNEGVKTGYAMYIGTGGDMDTGAADLEKMYYNPAEYGLLEFDDVLEMPHLRQETKVAGFIPSWMYAIIDRDGNSLKEKSIEFHNKSALAKKDKGARILYSVNHPIYPHEGFMVPTGGYFGEKKQAKLVERKSEILRNRALQITEEGNLYWNDKYDWSKGVYFEPGPDDKGKTYVVITERPKINESTGLPYDNLYKQGTDSYDRSEANTSTSVGSSIVGHGFLDADSPSYYPVARITIRPETWEGGAEAFYEEVVKLNIYYNAINLIEYSNLRIFDYYKNHGVSYLLKERPKLSIAKWINDTKVANDYGIDPQSKPFWLSSLSDQMTDEWIDSLYDVDIISALSKFRYEPSKGRYNCDTTISMALLSVLYEDERELEVQKYQETSRHRFPGVAYKRNGNAFAKV